MAGQLGVKGWVRRGTAIGRPWVTIQPTGLWINGTAKEAIDVKQHPWVLLSWDSTENKIGLLFLKEKKQAEKPESVYAVWDVGERGGARISCQNLMRDWDLYNFAKRVVGRVGFPLVREPGWKVGDFWTATIAAEKKKPAN